jgi:hypothetical protein
MKKFLKRTLITITALYVLVCVFMYFNQEKLIFFPTKLSTTHTFQFDQKFEERNIQARDGVTLNGILFKTEEPKGLVFLTHGNAGSLETIGGVAKTYTNLNYDVFILDYRGYGKSEGEITNQQQLFDDIQIAYDELKKDYNENQIIVLGYSIGTGLAAKIASTNNPKLLILEAPYYSLIDLMRHNYPYLPTFILKYKFETNEYLKFCKMPIVLFHGTDDNSIYFGSSKKLKKEFKERIELISLPDQGHNGISNNNQYLKELKRILRN